MTTLSQASEPRFVLALESPQARDKDKNISRTSLMASGSGSPPSGGDDGGKERMESLRDLDSRRKRKGPVYTPQANQIIDLDLLGESSEKQHKSAKMDKIAQAIGSLQELMKEDECDAKRVLQAQQEFEDCKLKLSTMTADREKEREWRVELENKLEALERERELHVTQLSTVEAEKKEGLELIARMEKELKESKDACQESNRLAGALQNCLTRLEKSLYTMTGILRKTEERLKLAQDEASANAFLHNEIDEENRMLLKFKDNLLQLPENKINTCSMCFRTKLIDQLKVLLCGHCICKKCWMGMIKEQPDMTKMKCPLHLTLPGELVFPTGCCFTCDQDIMDAGTQAAVMEAMHD